MVETANLDNFCQLLWDEISESNMLDTIAQFSKLHRYTGSPDGEKAVDYLEKKLCEYGVTSDRMPHEEYLSIPLKSEIKVVSPISADIPAIASVYSAEASGCRGILLYDEMGEKSKVSENANVERMARFRNRVVLTRELGIQMAMRCARAGALALIHIWPSDDEQIHHGTIGGAWGTPGVEDMHLIPVLPVLQITKASGDYLAGLCQKSPVTVEINVEMDTGVRRGSMPVAYIPGKTEKYVLVAGHYDSWYEGITDNAAANAIMLEMARIFQSRQSQLVHGVKIAWWSGHSDGRYAGSTWYCDNHWEDLNKNCLAYIYLDICGGKNTERIIPRSNLMEGPDLLPDLIEELTGERHGKFITMTKSGDQSFFGAGVPLMLYALNEPGPGGDTNFSNVGGGPWWHTVEDTLDKLDNRILMRDAKFNFYLAAYLCTSKRIPVHLTYFVSRMKEFLDAMMTGNEDFDLRPVANAFSLLENKISGLESALRLCDDHLYNDIVMQIAGNLVQIAYSSTDPYHYDPAWLPSKVPPFYFMQFLSGVHPEDCPEDKYLFHKTSFKRLCNRAVGEVNRTIDLIDCKISSLLKEMEKEDNAEK